MLLAIGIILAAAGFIGMLICWIMILIKMFKNEKPLIGILGILCSLWAFIWGWMKSSALGTKKIMLIWTACIVVYFIGFGLIAAGTPTQIQSGEFGTMQPIE